MNATFGKEPWFKKDVNPRKKSPQTSKDFDDFVKEAFTKCTEPGRSVLILWILRNYATHICDPEAPFFFDNLEKVFNEVVIAYIYYLKFKKLI